MHHRYENGLIVDYEAGEKLQNNAFYIIDNETQNIVVPKHPDDWLNNQVIYVYNAPMVGQPINHTINPGEICRCWKVWVNY